MKKVYEIRINSVDAYDGHPNGYRVVGYTLDANKAEEIKKSVVADMLARGGWYIATAKNDIGEPDVHVVELGEVWE